MEGCFVCFCLGFCDNLQLVLWHLPIVVSLTIKCSIQNFSNIGRAVDTREEDCFKPCMLFVYTEERALVVGMCSLLNFDRGFYLHLHLCICLFTSSFITYLFINCLMNVDYVANGLVNVRLYAARHRPWLSCSIIMYLGRNLTHYDHSFLLKMILGKKLF